MAAYGEGELPEEAALEVACTFGHPELTAVQLARSAELAAADREEAAWDPATQGLPADLTEDLSMQVPFASRNLSCTQHLPGAQIYLLRPWPSCGTSCLSKLPRPGCLRGRILQQQSSAACTGIKGSQVRAEERGSSCGSCVLGGRQAERA